LERRLHHYPVWNEFVYQYATQRIEKGEFYEIEVIDNINDRNFGGGCVRTGNEFEHGREQP